MNNFNFFLDTEFIEDGNKIDLISIGIISEDNDSYYAINSDCDFDQADDWVKENVIKQLETETKYWRSKQEIAADIIKFVYDKLETNKAEASFWSYYADYDWVVICQLFGKMIQLPDKFPKFCHDLKQECKLLGDPKLPPQESKKHNALADAKWNKEVLDYLDEFALELGKHTKHLNLIAMACYETIKLYSQAHGEFTHQDWEALDPLQKQGIVKGVVFRQDNPNCTPEDMHDCWQESKIAEGWVYGEVKDAQLKTHPCLVPYEELSQYQKDKDRIFIAIIDAMIDPIYKFINRYQLK